MHLLILDLIFLNRTYTFSYDVGGNITYKKEYAYTNGETLGVLLNTNTYTYHSVNKDQLISLNTKNCSYDIYGNPTTYMNDTLTWSRGTMLATYTTALNPKTITYTYDGEGSRTSKSWGVGLGRVSYEFHIEDDQLKEEERKGHNLNIKIEYIHGVNRLMGFKYNNTDYYYRRDIFGNVIEIYDKLTMVARYIYDAWGNHEVINYNGSNIGSINPIRYRGYYYDIETGLYYCNSRYYDPKVGRFISPDSIDYLNPESINGLNLYSYCQNNPIMYVDPSGHFWDTVFDILSIGYDIYSLFKNDGYKDWKNWAALGLDATCLVVPFISGGSSVYRVANGIDNVDDIHDSINALDIAGDISDVALVGRDANRVHSVGNFGYTVYDGLQCYPKLASKGWYGKVTAEILGKSQNAAWLTSQLFRGRTIVDIGLGAGMAMSSSYRLERIILGLYKERKIIRWGLRIGLEF